MIKMSKIHKSIIIIDLGKVYGGAEKVVENLAISLEDEVNIILYISEKNKNKFEFKCKSTDSQIIYVDNNIISYIKLIIETIKKNNDKKIKVINTHGMLANLIGLIIKVISKIRVITTIHSDIEYDFIGIKRKMYYLIEKLVVRSFDEVVTVSQNLNNKIILRHKVKSITIYNGIEFNKNPNIKENRNKDIFAFLFVGRLTGVKNIELLLEGLKYLKDKKIKFFCNIIGDGDEKDKLIKLSEVYNINELIKFHGYSDDIDRFMNLSDVLVLTSHMEGIPITIIEAFKNGLPVLASDVGGIREMIDNGFNGILFDKEDIREFKKCMYDLATYRYDLEKMGVNARNSYRDKWSIDIMGKNYKKIFLNEN